MFPLNQLSRTGRPLGTCLSPNDSSMRKLLRCKRTKAFLAEDGDWTHDIQKALALSEPILPKGLRDCLPAEEFEIYCSFERSRASQFDFTVSAH